MPPRKIARAVTIAVVASVQMLFIHPETAAAACIQGRPGRIPAVNTLNCPCNYQVSGSTNWWADCNAKMGLYCWGARYGASRCIRRPYSDIRLKKDIVPLGHLANGVGVYRFRYRGIDQTVYVGVMAQEVQSIVPGAVTRDRDGYLRVDYDRLGLEFMTWDEWLARNVARSRLLQ
jgi:hypothetical protein